MKKLKPILFLLISLILIGLIGWITFGEFPGLTARSARNIHLGLDLAGGVSITYQAADNVIPSEEEMKRGEQSLNENDYEVDYVITHCLPQDVASAIGFTSADCLTQYFSNLLYDGLKFNKWYCGHYHCEKQIFGKFNILYESIIRIL